MSRDYKIKLSPRTRLVVALRPYRSSWAQRHRVKPVGLTVPVYLFLRPTKEIYFKREITKSSKKLPSGSFRYIQRQSVVPFFLILVGFCGVVYFSNKAQDAQTEVGPAATFSLPAPNSIAKSEKQALGRSAPTRIQVKQAGIDAPVDPVGQSKDKSIEVPPLFENVTGWYKFSPTPGEIGPAIIVGHVDTYKGPSVFFKLKDLNAGDVIEITREDKKTVKFKVTGLKQFSQSDFPTEEVYGNIDYAGLRLITCGGTFNEKTLQYSANTVVFASMITK